MSANHRYQSIKPMELLSSHEGASDLTLLGTAFPLSQLYLSKEAKTILETLSMVTGDPILYLAVDQTNDVPKITLISKLDYHMKIHPALGDLPNLTIYEPTPSGFRWISGGAESDFQSPPPELLSPLITAKACLGYIEEFAEMPDTVREWVKSFTVEDKQVLNEYIARRGTPAQRKVFQKIL